MPDLWDATQFDDMYTTNYGWGMFKGGHVPFVDAKRWVTSIANNASYTPSTKTLIVGCGIGATVWYIRSTFGSNNIWGLDNSVYIHSIINDDAPEGFDSSWVINQDFLLATPDTLKPVVGGNGKMGWVITEDVIECIPLVDRPSWYVQAESLLTATGKVAHFVSVKSDDKPNIPPYFAQQGWTWQTIDEWALEAPNHYWFATNTNKFYIPA